MTPETILDLLKNKDYKTLKAQLSEVNPADIADLLNELPQEESVIAYRLLSKELATDVFAHLEGDNREALVRAFSDKELEEVIRDLFIDDAVDLIEEMPAAVVKRILQHTDPESRVLINEILNYPKDSAGSVMTTEFVTLRKDMTVEQAFARIRATGVDKETIYTCYVTDATKKLLGTISVKELLLSDYQTKIEDIMEDNPISVKTTDDKEEVAKQLTHYDFIAMPVTDHENRLVGIVTFDDAMDVIEDEAEEDFAIMAAVTPSEDDYLKTSIFVHAKNRIVWLLFLMLSATITGLIISHYEEAFAAVPVLVAFIPMLTDTGGNCGSQSSTMVIRGLATDEIEFKDFFKVLLKEFSISIAVGIILVLVSGIRILIMYRNNTDCPALSLALIVGIALQLTITLSKSLGCILPMIAQKLKLDPAIMAAPLITTIVDTCSVLIFFKIAMLVLHL
jgi:magnesium transporter